MFLLSFFQSEHILALGFATFIFLITILLVVKRWIGFPLALVLLIFSLVAGLSINHQQDFRHYFNSSHISEESVPTDQFHQQILQAIEDLRSEVSTEKENLQRVVNQVQEIFNSMDIQKQKLQNFIEEVREKLKVESVEHSSSPLPEPTLNPPNEH